VNIHWQPTPYHEKIALSASGTASQHIQINGIKGPQGQLPVLDAANATSSPNSPMFSYKPIEDLGLIVIFRDQVHGYGYLPSFIDINNLQLQGANAGTAYTGYDGDSRTYTDGASGIWMEGASDITIHGCVITNNSNGVFAKSGGDPATTTYRVTLDGNYLYGNGVANNYLYHNSYIEADGAVYQYNRYGPLRAGAPGNALKDRSAGTVIRYNYIQDGGHLLDLVDAQDGAPVLTGAPNYNQTFVYGNTLISDANGPTYLIHYGGDDYNYANYRNGTLYFYANTVINQANQSDRWRTNVFQLDTNSQTLDARNNILFNTSRTAGSNASLFELLLTDGKANFFANWVSPGWLPSHDVQPFNGSITGTNNFIVDPNNNPGFANTAAYDVHLTAGSGAIDRGGVLAAAAASYPVTQEYVYHQSDAARPVNGAAPDLGAFEAGAAAPPDTPPTVTGETPASNATGVAATTTVTVTLSESVQPNTIMFTLAGPGNAAVPAQVSYDGATNTATLTPSGPLSPSTTYTATVSGATDQAGNAMSPFSQSFTTAGNISTASTWQQTTAADFNAGTQSGTTVTNTSGGEVQLAPAVADDFNGTTLDSTAWTTTSWASASGSPTSITVSNGVLTLGSAEARSVQTITNTPVEGRIAFGAAPYQHFGLATDLAAAGGNAWAIFSTSGTTNTLYARVNANGVTRDVNLGALPSGYHVYRVQPTSAGFAFSVDGALKTTISASFATSQPLRIVLSAFSGSPRPPLTADWVRLASYSSSGTFTSSVFDATRAATWGTASWTASQPAGTSLIVETSSGNTATPDSTWSAWTAASNGRAVASPPARYLRYRVRMATTDPTVSPILYDLSITRS
jgi:parallel beta-helix repeat protein